MRTFTFILFVVLAAENLSAMEFVTFSSQHMGQFPDIQPGAQAFSIGFPKGWNVTVYASNYLIAIFWPTPRPETQGDLESFTDFT